MNSSRQTSATMPHGALLSAKLRSSTKVWGEATAETQADIRRGDPDDLWYDISIDLKAQFPTSALLSLQKVFPWACILLMACITALAMAGSDLFIDPRTAPVSALMVRIGIAVLVFKFFYHELRRAAHQYGTDGFRLVITQGLLFRREGSLPLLPISEIYVSRGWRDLFFGLYEVNIATPVNATKAFGVIGGLSYENAHGLQKFLAEQLNRQITVQAR